MSTFDIRYVRVNLSQLLDKAARGEAFVIAKAGKPLVKVTPLDAPMTSRLSRLGFRIDVGMGRPDTPGDDGGEGGRPRPVPGSWTKSTG